MIHITRNICFLIVLVCLVFGFVPSAAADDSGFPGAMSVESGAYQAADSHQTIFINSIGMKFKLLNPGIFTMGSVVGDEDEMPVHLVTISRPFYMGVYEVTQQQWEQIMGGESF